MWRTGVSREREPAPRGNGHEANGPGSRVSLRSPGTRSALRHHVLYRADPAGMGEVEHNAERVLVLGLIIGLRRGRTAGEIAAARIDHLLLGFIEIIDPHAEMI